MKITIFTLFPDWFGGPLGDSIIQRAVEAGKLQLDYVNFRQWTTDRHQSVDDRPYGGGAGMVLSPEPLAAALDETIGAPGTAGRVPLIYLSPRGKVFNQQKAIELSKLPGFALLCGHYEGVDQRIIDTRVAEELSLGDFVLTGGEIAAMAVVDAVARLLPGVLGNAESAQTESFMSGLLEAPQYTRPEVFEGHRVPPELLTGNHGEIAVWREKQALRLTKERRPDLIEAMILSPEQLRRFARRARPMIVYTSSTGWRSVERILFQSAIVAENPGHLSDPKLRKAEPTMVPNVWVAEVPSLRSESDEENRLRLETDIKSAMQATQNGQGALGGEMLRLLLDALAEAL